jgi:hypothetical protein
MALLPLLAPAAAGVVAQLAVTLGTIRARVVVGLVKESMAIPKKLTSHCSVYAFESFTITSLARRSYTHLATWRHANEQLPDAILVTRRY